MRRVYLALKAKASEEELCALERILGITPSWLSEIGSSWYPNRGIGPIPPSDPVIYRLFEVRKELHGHAFPSLPFLKGVLVYGHAIKVS